MRYINNAVFICCLSVALLSAVPLTAQEDNSPDRLLERADTYFDRGEYGPARTLLRRFLQQHAEHPQAARAAYLLGDAFRLDGALDRRRRLNEAVARYQEALANYPAAPEAPEAAYKTAVSYIDLGLEQDAIIQLRRARETYPRSTNADDILLLLADSYYMLEDYQQSARHYSIYLEEYTDTRATDDVLAKLADSYHRLGRWQQSLETFDRLLASRPNLFAGDPGMRFRYAEVLLKNGRHDDAQNHFQTVANAAEGTNLYHHARLRLGDLFSAMADAAAQETDSAGMRREAVEYFNSVWKQSENRMLSDAALLRLVHEADVAGISLENTFGYPSADALLMQTFERNLDGDMRSLILVRAARHHRANQRFRQALDYYKRVIQDYQGFPLVNQIVSEYRRLVRDLMEASWQAGDRTHYLDLYLGYGTGLELGRKDKIRLAQSYTDTMLYDKALELIDELRVTGLDKDEQIIVTTLSMDIHMERDNHVVAEQEALQLISLDPEPELRQRAISARLNILFADRDLESLKEIWFENRRMLETDRLRGEMLFMLGTLQSIEGDNAPAQANLEQLLDQYGRGFEDDLEFYHMLRRASLTLADLYYNNSRYSDASALYDRYLLLFQQDDEIAWPLLYGALSHRELGHTALAREMLETFLTRYPDHFLMARAQSALNGLGGSR